MIMGFGAFGRNVRSGGHRNSSGDLAQVGTSRQIWREFPRLLQLIPASSIHWSEARGALLRLESQLRGASQIQPFHSPDRRGAVRSAAMPHSPIPGGLGSWIPPDSHPVPPSPGTIQWQ